jgi:hypothetical protein
MADDDSAHRRRDNEVDGLADPVRKLGAGLSRDLLAGYGPGFLLAGLTCVAAAAALVTLRPARPQMAAAG